MNWSRFYHQRLIEIYQSMIPPKSKVLEIGCARGELLASLNPELGVGIDFSNEMLKKAREKFPQLFFVHADAHALPVSGDFEFIIMSDLVNDLWDVQTVFKLVSELAGESTRIIINCYSRLWEPALKLAKQLNLARPLLNQNWLTPTDIRNLLELEQIEIVRRSEEILWPIGGEWIGKFINRFLVRFWPFNQFAMTNFFIARPRTRSQLDLLEPSVSIIVPARNEAGNIKEVIETTPSFGRSTEIVFVEGHSTDNTYAQIQHEIKSHPEVNCKVFKQTGNGKADAVRLGMSEASGDIVIILDADLTVSPDQLPRFYYALFRGRGELINGSRLVYPREDGAMQFVNMLGNKFFGLSISWLIGQEIKDTLCGTKALWKKDFTRFCENQSYFGEFDPFGDFDLLFNAAKLGLKIVDLPVRYRSRSYGETNINRWRDGALLLRMLLVAARKIKFT
jgi:GT2 family glycosyltransferase